MPCHSPRGIIACLHRLTVTIPRHRGTDFSAAQQNPERKVTPNKIAAPGSSTHNDTIQYQASNKKKPGHWPGLTIWEYAEGSVTSVCISFRRPPPLSRACRPHMRHLVQPFLSSVLLNKCKCTSRSQGFTIHLRDSLHEA